jgi:ubiquinone/menaquinone biosynthesis C-methylase UbiE
MERLTRADTFEKRSMENYNSAAAGYDTSPEGWFTYRFNRKVADTAEIPDGSHVLDIACGSGRLLGMLRATNNFEGFGVDISEEMIKTARRANPDMEFHTAPCDSLPFGKAFFNVVTTCTAFHHFPSVVSFAEEAYRVLAPGGHLYIADVYYSAFWRTVLNPFVRFSPAGDVRFYAPEEITQLLERARFSVDPVLVEGNLQLITARK